MKNVSKESIFQTKDTLMHQVLSVILILVNKINKVNHLNLEALNYNTTDEANYYNL